MNDKQIIAEILTDYITLDEYGVSLAEKWMFVQNTLGLTKGEDIMYSFSSEDFERIYRSDNEEAVNAHLFIAQIRYSIFCRLLEEHPSSDPDNHLELGKESSVVWANKLHDRAVSLVTGDEVQHTWIN